MKALLMLSLCLCLFSGTNNESRTASAAAVVEDSEDLKKIIQGFNDEFEKAYKKGDLDKVTSMMADQVVQFAPNHEPLKGKDDVKKYWQELVSLGEINFSLKTQEVRSNGPLAVEWGTYDLAFNPKDNASPVPAFTDKGNYLVLWEKVKGQWKIVWDAPVSTVPVNP